MNDSKQLFNDMFCNPSNERVARMYLASLMDVTEEEEEYRTKIRQISLLKNFFESTQCPNKDRYLQTLRDAEEILEKDRIVSGWAKYLPEELKEDKT